MTDPKHTDTSRSGDLVKMLYDQADRRHGSIGSLRSLEWQAADRIEALEAENKRLREVVKHYGDTLCEGIGECVGDFCGKLSSDECAGCFARAELERIADE